MRAITLFLITILSWLSLGTLAACSSMMPGQSVKPGSELIYNCDPYEGAPDCSSHAHHPSS